MNLKLELVMLVALSLLTMELAFANVRSQDDTKYAHCTQEEDRDWTHHQYSVLEFLTTDILTPNELYSGTAPLQNGTLITMLCSFSSDLFAHRRLVTDVFANI
jgi:hypothetical protein